MSLTIQRDKRSLEDLPKSGLIHLAKKLSARNHILNKRLEDRKPTPLAQIMVSFWDDDAQEFREGVSQIIHEESPLAEVAYKILAQREATLQHVLDVLRDMGGDEDDTPVLEESEVDGVLFTRQEDNNE